MLRSFSFITQNSFTQIDFARGDELLQRILRPVPRFFGKRSQGGYNFARFMPLLDELNPETGRARELKSAPDAPALEQSKVRGLGTHGNSLRC